VLTSRGVLYSRGESYDENRFYSDPADWPRLAESHRREFLQRTDRGVFSLQAEAALNQARGFRTLAGRAAAIEAREQDVIVTIAYGEERERVAYVATDKSKPIWRSAAANPSARSALTCPWPAWRPCTCRSWPGLRRARGFRISAASVC